MNTAEAIAYLKTVPELPVTLWAWAPTSVTTPAGGRYEFRTPSAKRVCELAEVDIDAGVLAAVGASEFPKNKRGEHYPAYLLAGMRAVINDATVLFPDLDGRRAPDAILRRCTAGRVANGFFGRQAGGGFARYCSSYQAPTLRTLAAARFALEGIGEDIAPGARRWIDPKVQDGGVQAGEKLKNDAEAILRSRYAEGWRWADPHPEIHDYKLALLTKVPGRGVSLAEALQRLEAARLDWYRK